MVNRISFFLILGIVCFVNEATNAQSSTDTQPKTNTQRRRVTQPNKSTQPKKSTQAKMNVPKGPNQRTSKLRALARPYRDSVLLRWAPDNAEAWQVLNKEGYIVKRLTVYRNGKYMLRPFVKILTPTPIKPWPMAAWEPFVNAEDKHGSIAAQALYGEDFEVTQQIKDNPAQVLNLLRQNEQRFSIALFSADQSFRIAKAMGLGLVDSTAKSTEKYKYIILPGSKMLKHVDSASVDVAFVSARPLPKPFGLDADALDKGVMLSWPTKAFLGVFTYYQLERSEDDGQTFVATSSLPVINTQAKDDLENADKAFELDSVSALERLLVYRVKGVSPFGEVGPPSDTIHVTAYHQLKSGPVLKRVEAIKGAVQIDWFLPETKAEVTGFDIERSDRKEKGYTKINAQLVSPKDSSFVDPKPNPVNFYRVRAYAKNSDSKVSFSQLVQMPDSIPPAAPTGASGVINKEGIVKLKWKANTEPDVYGYRVFRSNTEDGEYSQVTDSTRIPNNFTDTIELKTMSKYVYYKFVAIDKRFNPSAFSEVLRLKRPDVVPPVAPSLTEVRALTSGIRLTWFNSRSEDVVKHELLRTVAGKDAWKVLVTFTDTTHTYVDETAELNQSYTYKVRAMDDSYLTSESKAFTAKRLDLGLKPNITTFSGTADRENQQVVLKWNYQGKSLTNYVLYKAEQGKPLRLYKTVDGALNTFQDPQLYINTIYEYRIKAIFADGSETGFSNPIIVNY